MASNYPYDYPSPMDSLAKQTAEAGLIRVPNLRENIAIDLARAKANVARLEELAKLIDENPSTSRILELMGQR
jgi:hypothetical protein